MEATPDARLTRARTCLSALSVGDAFGERFFFDGKADWRIETRTPPPFEGGWRWTDDTAMAAGLLRHLQILDEIDDDNVDELATRWATLYMHDPYRGYGPHIQGLLTRIYAGGNWRTLAREPFDGTGSMGNGSAMRTAPLGAWFADRRDDPQFIADQAKRSADITHPHPDGVAGAIAVALATAYGWDRAPDEVRDGVYGYLLPHLPCGPTRRGVEEAAGLPHDAEPTDVARYLGNGSRVTCPDTVPLCLWIAAAFAGEFEGAIWATVSTRGDVDTTCAIVGGIISGQRNVSVPQAWLNARHALPG